MSAFAYLARDLDSVAIGSERALIAHD